MTKKSSNSATKPKVIRKAKSGAKKGSSAKTSEEVQATLFQVIGEDFALSGKEEFSKAMLAAAVGYSNPRSAGFQKLLGVFYDQAIFEKGSKDCIRLTKKGIDSMPKIEPPKSNEEYFEKRLKPLIVKKLANPAKFDELWQILLDGAAHEIKGLASTLGYGNPRSAGFSSMVTALKEAKMVESAGKGAIKLTDEAFPFGRS